jgi:ABC-type transport system involved in multi-copper enzyme maturation permease subunit
MSVMLSVFMLSVMLSVIMLSVILLSVIMLNVAILSVIMLNFIMQTVIMLIVVMLSVMMQSIVMFNVIECCSKPSKGAYYLEPLFKAYHYLPTFEKRENVSLKENDHPLMFKTLTIKVM